MKERQHSTRWLGLALTCGFLTFAVTTQAAKPPKPPPTPTGPAYRIISLGNLGGSNWDTWGPVNDLGWVLGNVAYNASGGLPAVCVVVPEPSTDGPVYFRDTSPADGINDLAQILPGLRNSNNYGAWDINNAGVVAGGCYAGSPFYTATIWVGGAPLDLGIVADEDLAAYGVNNLGLVVTGPILGAPTAAPCYVVVPKDNNDDGVPDTWFEDLNGDGVNDLLKLLTQQIGSWTPAFAPEGGINDAGQIIVNSYPTGDFRLSPDYTDAEGDGNPWFADANADGFNDLMEKLIPLPGEYASSHPPRAAHINAAGQVVGACSKRAVVWNFSGGIQTVSALPLLSSKVLSMGAAGINDVGQIVGGVSYRNGGTVFLFQDGKISDLAALLVNATGWTSLSASDINNQSVISGVGDFNGVRQGFVAIPVAQP